ncbi:(Lyso)-N-acylphosphatidylethanolamine lipase [Uranotaenia lowii]|uniref:(Lyso)-N-acylphosphatidylethanolamine lipase n=1 Tax=Uranotaenia lowii TaxID=190385 RepID=UPI002478CC4F|nr:(Lyso)-N-acylphosphatidylethanolamine lipase [Uranotaenia lowii]
MEATVEDLDSKNTGQPNDNSWFSWTRYSFSMLRTIEKSIFSHLRLPYRGMFVDVGPCVGEADKIWTITMNNDSKRIPILLLHGLGSGVGLWVLNLDAIAQNRPLYAIDILGFGRSSRPKFSDDAMIAEKQLVKSIDEWRKEMGLQEMIILGHSMGGFLASSYALSYPDRVKHLILADPWGFPEKPKESSDRPKPPLWAKAILAASKPLNPLWILRFFGPLGPWLVGKTRPDILRKFSGVISNTEDVTNYIHQCNAQNPTGESAFHTMMHDFGWAKNPMVNRLHELKSSVPITFLYGARSWIDNRPGDVIRELRQHSYVKIHSIPQAGHHVYADDAETFNRLVNEACATCDEENLAVVRSGHGQGKDSDVKL